MSGHTESVAAGFVLGNHHTAPLLDGHHAIRAITVSTSQDHGNCPLSKADGYRFKKPICRGTHKMTDVQDEAGYFPPRLDSSGLFCR